MRVSVTGATGFVGAHVVRLLCERGDAVQVTYRNPGRLRALAGLEVRHMRADVRDYRALRRAFEGAEVVFHTVGYVGSRPTDWCGSSRCAAPGPSIFPAPATGSTRCGPC